MDKWQWAAILFPIALFGIIYPIGGLILLIIIILAYTILRSYPESKKH